SSFSDIDTVKESFYDYALKPFEWNGGLYALPETQTWSMLFYRKDILDELGIALDELETWDSILESVLPKLKKSSLSFGIMPTIQNYITFLYQSGGSLYSEDGRESALNSSEAIESMKLFSFLYTQYGFQLSYDFSNRFRNGEMPIAIAEFTSYNNLMLFAPEIKGLWGMLPVPGTVREDGSVDQTTVATFTGTVMMADTKKPNEAWEFMKWWSSDETQDAFGKRLEAVVGTASRYNTANKNAIARVQWDPDMRESMRKQVEMLREYPEVPGGYFTSRLFNFAFRSIVYDSQDVRESMNDVANDISLEMKNKRDEYGIE
ncbi:MAG: ABC transporter substrate-binding protein, partial [Acutalibacteraceae bacterium]